MRKKFQVIILLIAVIFSMSACSFSWNFQTLKDWLSGEAAIREQMSSQDYLDQLDVISSINSGINTPQDSDNEFIFEESKINHVVKDNGQTTDYKKIYLYLGDGIYYPVRVPTTVDFVTDNSKYVYAKDSSYSISVVSNIDINQFSEVVFVKDAETIKKSLLVTI